MCPSFRFNSEFVLGGMNALFFIFCRILTDDMTSPQSQSTGSSIQNAQSRILSKVSMRSFEFCRGFSSGVLSGASMWRLVDGFVWSFFGGFPSPFHTSAGAIRHQHVCFQVQMSPPSLCVCPNILWWFPTALGSYLNTPHTVATALATQPLQCCLEPADRGLQRPGGSRGHVAVLRLPERVSGLDLQERDGGVPRRGHPVQAQHGILS